MPNALANAAFLDGSTGWAAGADGALSVDEATLGGPGRRVLVCSVSTDGSALEITSDVIALVEGERVFVQVLARAGGDRLVTASLETDDGLTVLDLPMVRPPSEVQAHGVREGLAQFTLQTDIPADGDWRVAVRSTEAMTGARTLSLSRPILAPARADGLPVGFDPGLATEDDWDLPVWPSVLRPFRSPAQLTPVANRLPFQTATGHNKTRLMYREPPTDLRASVRCTPGERSALDAFYASGVDRFWLVRPDTDELCVATWLTDGAPRPVEFRGPTTIMEVGLQLTVA